MIILASTSIYRKELLERTGFAFTCTKPNCDEEVIKKTSSHLSPLKLAELLSFEKGQSVFKNNPDATVISGDQIVSFKNEIIGKSGTAENAFQQLNKLKNETHELITAVTIFNKKEILNLNHISKMKMRNLSDHEIKNYISIDQPIDCAGSYKIEKSGISLFEKIETDDFTAIQGLPLIWITTQLKGLGYELFKRS